MYILFGKQCRAESNEERVILDALLPEKYEKEVKELVELLEVKMCIWVSSVLREAIEEIF